MWRLFLLDQGRRNGGHHTDAVPAREIRYQRRAISSFAIHTLNVFVGTASIPSATDAHFVKMVSLIWQIRGRRAEGVCQRREWDGKVGIVGDDASELPWSVMNGCKGTRLARTAVRTVLCEAAHATR